MAQYKKNMEESDRKVNIILLVTVEWIYSAFETYAGVPGV